MLMMFSIALGLRGSDFVRIAERPLIFLAGVLSQVVGLPLLTFGIIHLFAPPPSIALGMIVVACCPGVASSNLLTYLGRGDVAFSVSLTATSSLLAALLTPASILLWSHAYEPTATLLQSIDVRPLSFLLQTMLLLGVPLIIGMLMAVRTPAIAERIRRYTGIAGATVLGGVIVYGTVYFFPILIESLPYLATVAILHSAAAFLLGAATGLVTGVGRGMRRALTFEVGIQNSGLALVILVGQLHGVGGAAAIAAVWGVWHLVAGGFIVGVFRLFDLRRGDA